MPVVLSMFRFNLQRGTATMYTHYWTLLFLTNQIYSKKGTPATVTEKRRTISQNHSIAKTHKIIEAFRLEKDL